jgi:hypothetical protein
VTTPAVASNTPAAADRLANAASAVTDQPVVAQLTLRARDLADARNASMPGVADRAGVTDAAVPENFAADPRNSFRAPRWSVSSPLKSALVAGGKQVEQGGDTLGIGGAKQTAMPSGSLLERSSVADSTVVHAGAAVDGLRSEPAALPPMVAMPSTAQRAVEAALAATERFSARDQHSVTLQFTVGGNELNVRVELRGSEVHTTFRTDSPELRSALSAEWQSVTTQSNADRTVRLATPVFSSNSDAPTSSSDQGANRQRQPETEARQPAFSLSGSNRTTTAAAHSAPAPAARTLSANAVHLHTLA